MDMRVLDFFGWLRLPRSGHSRTPQLSLNTTDAGQGLDVLPLEACPDGVRSHIAQLARFPGFRFQLASDSANGLPNSLGQLLWTVLGGSRSALQAVPASLLEALAPFANPGRTAFQVFGCFLGCFAAAQ